MSMIDMINVPHSRRRAGPGFLGFIMVGMWFLLTVLNPGEAHAQDVSSEYQTPVILTPADILPDIEAALTAQGMDAGAEVTFANAKQQFALSGPAQFDHVSFNPLSGRFVMRLSSTSGDPAITIAGTARTAATYPVLARAVDRGEIIQAGDIVFVESAAPNAAAYVTSADGLIGMEARRNLRAQTPLRTNDVAAPVLVKKGALVTLAYVMKGLRLTHQGVALSTGARGDVIAVRNVQSERVLKAIIDGENFVRVMSPRANTPLEG